VEKESSPPYLKDTMMDLEKKTMNSEDTMSTVIPHSAMGSNKLNNPPITPNLAQYVCDANYLQCESSPTSHIKHHGSYLLLGPSLQQLSGVWLGLLRGMKFNLL
jgi:hypothetical protein